MSKEPIRFNVEINVKYCPHCGENMSDTENRHHGCSVMSPSVTDDALAAATSCSVAAMTNSAVLGLLDGGYMLGAVAGDILFDGDLDII